MKYLLLFFLSFSAFCQTVQIGEVQSQEKKDLSERQKILLSFESMNIEDPKDFSDKLQDIRGKASDFIGKNKDMCSGLYTEVKIENNELQENLPQKLSDEEKEACMQELKNFEFEYTKKVFKARKQHLQLLHKKQTTDLQSLEDQTLAELERAYSKKNKKRARR